jgi:hypothetical protein
MAWQEVLIITILTITLIIICYAYFSQRKRYNEVMLELNNQSLDYHLKKIAEYGYDFNLKAGRNLKAGNDQRKSSKRSNAKAKPKTFENLVE